jgi:hypothetical protein
VFGSSSAPAMSGVGFDLSLKMGII